MRRITYLPPSHASTYYLNSVFYLCRSSLGWGPAAKRRGNLGCTPVSTAVDWFEVGAERQQELIHEAGEGRFFATEGPII